MCVMQSANSCPGFIAPMLAGSGVASVGEGWAAEVKWDGIRAQLRFDGRTVCVRSRPGRDCTEEFSELASIAGDLARHSVILDAELVCLDVDGKPDFGQLRARLGRRSDAGAGACRAPATLMVFDVLHLDGRAVRQLPYVRRRELLGELHLEGAAWRTPRHFDGQGQALLTATAEQGLEGVVNKRLDALYIEGRRSHAWVKHKHRRRERLVVSGWRERNGALPEFLLARRDAQERLRPVGSASLGLDAERRAMLLRALAEHEVDRRRHRGATRWAKPIVEVLVDAHGSVAGPVRDPILREVYYD